MALSSALRKAKEYIGFGEEAETGYTADYSGGYTRSEAPVHAPEISHIHTMTTIHPRTFEDARAIGEAFRAGITTVVNVVALTEADARRIIDFASGLVFALNGSIERVDTKVFILSPAEIAVVDEHNNPSSKSTDFMNIG